MQYKNHKIMGKISNKSKGEAFEILAKEILEQYLGQVLKRPKPIEGHKFDWATPNSSIVVECKCLEWTKSGNVPSAKIDNLNAAVIWLTKISATKKILCMKRSVHATQKETLAEYFVRTSKFLTSSDVTVIEIDEENKKIKKFKKESPCLN